MVSTGVLPDARTAVEVLSARLTGRLRGLPHTQTPIPDSAWSVRDAAAHLICVTTLYSELAAGVASPISQLTPPVCDRFNAQRLSDIADTEPGALAKSMTAAIDEFVETTTRRAESTRIAFHGGTVLDLGQLTCMLVAEYLLHGYDITRTAGTTWPIDPAHAALALYGYTPLNPHITDPATTEGHTATYRLQLGVAGACTARFSNGTLRIEPDPPAGTEPSEGIDSDAPDCVITADPVAFLLISTGRISQWAAIALGLMTVSGTHPELGPGFGDLFHRF